jgi:hypothetical protein
VAGPDFGSALTANFSGFESRNLQFRSDLFSQEALTVSALETDIEH